MLWTFGELETPMPEEKDCITSPTAIYRCIEKRQGYPLVTDDTFGSPSLVNQTTIMPISEVFSEYGKLHAVYVTRTNYVFLLNAVFWSEPLAEEYVDILHEERTPHTSIVTSVYSAEELEKKMSRTELDSRGHHYMSTE